MALSSSFLQWDHMHNITYIHLTHIHTQTKSHTHIHAHTAQWAHPYFPYLAVRPHTQNYILREDTYIHTYIRTHTKWRHNLEPIPASRISQWGHIHNITYIPRYIHTYIHIPSEDMTLSPSLLPVFRSEAKVGLLCSWKIPWNDAFGLLNPSAGLLYPSAGLWSPETGLFGILNDSLNLPNWLWGTWKDPAGLFGILNDSLNAPNWLFDTWKDPAGLFGNLNDSRNDEPGSRINCLNDSRNAADTDPVTENFRGLACAPDGGRACCVDEVSSISDPSAMPMMGGISYIWDRRRCVCVYVCVCM
jgi:hypothetical protein